MNDLILGTAQLGQRYGIANRTGQPDVTTIHAIVRAAWEHGIRAFDTAPEYGIAERLLGDALAALGRSFDARIVTKLAHDIDVHRGYMIIAAVERSHERLRVPQFHGLLLRRAFLDAWASVQPVLDQLVSRGAIERVGVSVYTPDEALRALAIDGVTFIQVPTNILDRRFLVAGVFDRAQALEKRVIVRSAFLQGLLTMSPEDAPPIPGAREALLCIRRTSDALGMRPIALALAYVRERCPGAAVVIGAETPEQVAELADLWQQHAAPCAETIERYVPGGALDLIDPTRWYAAIR